MNSQAVNVSNCFDEDLVSMQAKKRFPRTKQKQSLTAFTFPMLLKFPIVAKFLCQSGRNESLINFEKAFELFLEREPQNKYDNRAIKVGVRQAERDLLVKGMEHASHDENEFENEAQSTLFLGYVPKDTSYNLSVLLDNSRIFDFKIIDYCSERSATSVVYLLVDLHRHILRDYRHIQSQNDQLLKSKERADIRAGSTTKYSES